MVEVARGPGNVPLLSHSPVALNQLVSLSPGAI
jgi:hypothetical protein